MDSHRTLLDRLHGEIRALHARFEQVTVEYDARHLTLKEEVVLLYGLIHETGAVMDRAAALMAA